jgi:hypothetical protein
MLWMVLDMGFHPSEYEMETALDYAGLLLIAAPQLSAFAALWYAWKRPGVKMFMIAAMLSGFSFAGPLAIMAEVILWIAYKRHDLEWEMEKHREEFVRGLTGVASSLLFGATSSFMVVGILVLISALSGSSTEDAGDEAIYGVISVLVAVGLAVPILLMSRSRREKAS